MFKLLAILFLVSQIERIASFTCPLGPITAATLGGNLPVGATSLTIVPTGTNCTFTFDIPNNFALLLKFSADFQSEDDTVTFIDNRQVVKYLSHNGKILYESPYWVSPKSAQVTVVGVSGNSKFMLGYMYQALNDYKKVTKKTGEYFALSEITSKTYYTVTASSDTEKVVLTPAKKAGEDLYQNLEYYYVYDGDNINTANMIGYLADFKEDIVKSSGKSYTIVNFYEKTSSSYVLGNDASTLKGFSTYLVTLTTKQRKTYGEFQDLSYKKNGAAYTFICTDCSTFYWTKLNFDSFGTISNKGYVTFQGQTPTDNLEKLIKYDAMTFLDSSLPQLLPTNIFTINLYLSAMKFEFNTGDDDTEWKKPVDRRTGFVFSPSLWGNPVNSFDYEFRDDSQLYNFTLNINKMSISASNDQMSLKIGSGSGTPSVNNQYPRDHSSNGRVMSNGNYMQVGLAASVSADVRLSFEMRKANSSSAIGLLTVFLLILFYKF